MQQTVDDNGGDIDDNNDLNQAVDGNESGSDSNTDLRLTEDESSDSSYREVSKDRSFNISILNRPPIEKIVEMAETIVIQIKDCMSGIPEYKGDEKDLEAFCLRVSLYIDLATPTQLPIFFRIVKAVSG